MRRKRTPPSQFLFDRINEIQADTEEEARQKIEACLVDIRYAGDIKQIAESYGLHYLKSKRMRTGELRQWIVGNHPIVKEAKRRETYVKAAMDVAEDDRKQQACKEPERVIGVDWSLGDAGATVVVEAQPDGSIKILSEEVTPNGTG